MKKKYYVEYGEFSNQYNLYWAEENDPVNIPGVERITRKQAEQLCREERNRRKYNPAFAYRADGYIWPIDTPHYYRSEDIAHYDVYTYIDGYSVMFRRTPSGKFK